MIRACLFVLITAITGCSSDEQKIETQKVSNVFAVVGGVEVSSDDLRTASLRSLKKKYSELPKELQERLLESVISTVAMSQSAQAEAQHYERISIENSVAAYRDELWVKEYLKEHAVPQPVSNKQIEEYYTSHPESFGGGEIVEYTHIRCRYSENTKVKNCTQLLAENNVESWLENAKNHTDISVVNATLNTLVEVNNIDQLILTTVEQEFSGFTNTASELNRVFIIKKRKLTPKPLVAVQKEIRERLAPLQLKKAIKEASERARLNIEIVRKK